MLTHKLVHTSKQVLHLSKDLRNGLTESLFSRSDKSQGTDWSLGHHRYPMPQLSSHMYQFRDIFELSRGDHQSATGASICRSHRTDRIHGHQR